jgi:hypothetical protein
MQRITTYSSNLQSLRDEINTLKLYKPVPGSKNGKRLGQLLAIGDKPSIEAIESVRYIHSLYCDNCGDTREELFWMDVYDGNYISVCLSCLREWVFQAEKLAKENS